jgi:membrane-bound metal-dependent hydrolase YbcI (DUF457 family)
MPTFATRQNLPGAIAPDAQLLLSIPPVPTPIGHALAGLTIAWIGTARLGVGPQARTKDADPMPDVIAVGIAVVCAVLPDTDILFGTHRTWTHSLGALAGCTLIVALAAKALQWPAGRTALLASLAYSSHIALDWLGKDTAVPRGVMAFWPISNAYFVSGLDVFAEVSRRYWKPDEFIAGNLLSIARELVILGPLALAARFWARTRERR